MNDCHPFPLSPSPASSQPSRPLSTLIFHGNDLRTQFILNIMSFHLCKHLFILWIIKKKSNINSSLCNLLKLVIGIKYSRIPVIEWLLMSSVYWGLLHSLQYSLTFVWVSSWARMVGPWGHGCTKKSLPIGYYKYLATNIFFVATDGRTKLCVEVASCLKSGSILYTEFFKKITFLNRRASFG